MEKVDAKKELDTMFAHLSDVVHFVGVTMAKGAHGEPLEVAFVRLILPTDGPLRPWPKKLVYKMAVEAGTGMKMFSIHEPGKFMDALLTAEWEPSYENFIRAALREGVFMVEIITPSRKLGALVIGDDVKNTIERAITPEQYVELQNSYTPPKTTPGS